MLYRILVKYRTYMLVVICFACKKQQNNSVNYAEHIAPILLENCISCHQNGGTAPFELLTYKQAFRKKKTIARVTKSRYMPPWPANRNYSHFVGEKFLTQNQISMIQKWVNHGAPAGNLKTISQPLRVPQRLDKPKPDLVITADSIKIHGNNRDTFFIIKLPFELPNDTFLRSIEFVAGEHNLVHHMNGHLLSYQDQKKKSVFNGEKKITTQTDAFYEDFIAMDLFNDDGSKPQRIHSAVNYLPGVEHHFYPNGIGGAYIKKKNVLVFNDIHFGPIPKDLWDQSIVKFYFTDKAPSRPTREIMMGTNGVTPIKPSLQIPPDTIMKFTSQAIVPEDMSILTINPHMHLLGKSFRAFCMLPNGDTLPLIDIPRWDFRWQYFYTFKKMQKVPKGSIIKLEAYFDNTSENKWNPFDPPQWIGERIEKGGASMRTTDEMLQFIITWMPYLEGDEEISLLP